MFVGTKSSQSRIRNYKAKIRAYSGRGAPPDYTSPVIQQKLAGMSCKAQPAFGD